MSDVCALTTHEAWGVFSFTAFSFRCRHSARVLTKVWIHSARAHCPRFCPDIWQRFTHSNRVFISLPHILRWNHPRIEGCELLAPPRLPPQWDSQTQRSSGIHTSLHRCRLSNVQNTLTAEGQLVSDRNIKDLKLNHGAGVIQQLTSHQHSPSLTSVNGSIPLTYQYSVLGFAVFRVKLNATYKLDGCLFDDLPDAFCGWKPS